MQSLSGVITARDEHTVFGEHIANKMRNCKRSHMEISIAQHYIHDILLRLEMGIYDNGNPSLILPQFFPSQYPSNSPSPSTSNTSDSDFVTRSLSNPTLDSECTSEDVRSFVNSFTTL